MTAQKKRVQVCLSILRPVADFIEKQDNFANTLPSIYHYRKPVIKRSKGKIYIEYYFRIPVKLRQIYAGKIWHRFRTRDDINRRGEAKEQYAEWLRNEIEQSLRRGFNPFNNDTENTFVESQELGFVEKEEINATDALQLFIEAWRKRGLDRESSLPKYERIVSRLTAWLAYKQIPYIDIRDLTTNHIEAFLHDMHKRYGFGNREYNNHFTFTRTIFIWLLKKKYITDNPCVGIDQLKANVTKHRFFDSKTLEQITRVMQLKDPYTYLAFQTVYYLCIRSEKELKNLQVGSILWDQNKVLVEISKGKSEDYIPLDENLKTLFIERGIDKFPDDYYVFGIEGKPAVKPFGKGFFSKRFKELREFAGLSAKHSLYGAKHTRVCHLKLDGANDADVMNLTRHKDFTAYAKYLRDIGLSADATKLNKISRKI